MNRKRSIVVVILLISAVLCLSAVQLIVDKSKNKTIAAAYLNVNQTVVKDFEYYKSINEDVELVIYLLDRTIPVMKNDSYFKKDIYGKYDSLGTAYIDAYSVPKNMLIQGHSSAKNNLMFTSLKEYLNADYFKANKNIVIENKDAKIELEILGIISVNLSDEEPYLSWYDTNYRNDEAMVDYVDEFKRYAILFNNDIEIDIEDELVTLITCDRRYEDGRIVILTKKINENSGQIN